MARHSDPAVDVYAFGIELRAARVRRRLKQSEVAAHMGWHSTAISQLEIGDRASLPEFKTAKKLDRFLKANGRLLVAAGFAPPLGVHSTPIFQVSIPPSFTEPQVRMVRDYIDLIARANRCDEEE